MVKVFLLSHLAGLGMNLSLLLRKLTHVLLPSRLTAFQPGGPQPVCQLRLSKSLCISRAVRYLDLVEQETECVAVVFYEIIFLF